MVHQGAGLAVISYVRLVFLEPIIQAPVSFIEVDESLPVAGFFGATVSLLFNQFLFFFFLHMLTDSLTFRTDYKVDNLTNFERRILLH